MTAPSTPREQRQRVSDERLATLYSGLGYNALDTRESRRVLVEVMDSYKDARVTIAQRDAEIAQLREALATAQRDGWIAGRDAAAEYVSAFPERTSTTEALGACVRALAPPAAADGGRNE